MKERRPLVEGLKPVAPEVEKAFVYQTKPEPKAAVPEPKTLPAEVKDGNSKPDGLIGRLSLSMRIRADYARALKRASLQRQLDGVEPNQLQDIIEVCLEPWLREHGYLE